ncbi:unnamed protein product [Haemonchus placei]|uniref:DLC n=1 Tax=Haemonchus placei TaxID=6290 RepID=A0A0N4WRJ5_HAEPC|nr:unnamed protein product [Haemonchus placei]
MSQRSNSGGSDESLAERSVATSVIRDTGTKARAIIVQSSWTEKTEKSSEFYCNGVQKGKPCRFEVISSFPSL